MIRHFVFMIFYQLTEQQSLILMRIIVICRQKGSNSVPPLCLINEGLLVIVLKLQPVVRPGGVMCQSCSLSYNIRVIIHVFIRLDALDLEENRA